MKYLLTIFLLISTVSCNNILVPGPKTPEIKKVFSELKCLGKAETMTERKLCGDVSSEINLFEVKIEKMIKNGKTQELIGIKKDIESNVCNAHFSSNDGTVSMLQEATVDHLCILATNTIKSYLLTK